jgi:hypothetical protein
MNLFAPVLLVYSLVTFLMYHYRLKFVNSVVCDGVIRAERAALPACRGDPA